jgi:hypothetical protein
MRNRKFESMSLQQRVVCELGFSEYAEIVIANRTYRLRVGELA